jgi:hypothetical protein
VEQKCVEDPSDCAPASNAFVQPEHRCLQFKCPNGRCIPASKRCDGLSDCDGTARVRSLARAYDARTGKETLTYGSAYADSGASSDEQTTLQQTQAGQLGACLPWVVTQQATCRADEKRCATGISARTKSPCIPDVWYCDGIQDCVDNSDEASESCLGTKIVQLEKARTELTAEH